MRRKIFPSGGVDSPAAKTLPEASPTMIAAADKPVTAFLKVLSICSAIPFMVFSPFVYVSKSSQTNPPGGSRRSIPLDRQTHRAQRKR